MVILSQMYIIILKKFSYSCFLRLYHYFSISNYKQYSLCSMVAFRFGNSAVIVFFFKKKMLLKEKQHSSFLMPTSITKCLGFNTNKLFKVILLEKKNFQID